MKVQLKSTQKVEVKTLKDASEACRKFIQEISLTSEQWQRQRGGQVYDNSDNPIAHISHNGKIWTTADYTEADEIIGITIPSCAEHEGFPGNAITVYLVWVCSFCGKPRGDIYETLSYDGSRRLNVNGWKNDCGHTEKYAEVREEAAQNGLNAYLVGRKNAQATSANSEKVVCPHCNGTTLDLSANEDGGGCPHCFNGYVSA